MFTRLKEAYHVLHDPIEAFDAAKLTYDGLTEQEWQVRQIVVAVLENEGKDLEFLDPEAFEGLNRIKGILVPDSEEDCSDCGH